MFVALTRRAPPGFSAGHGRNAWLSGDLSLTEIQTHS
jgi:hypothetical protein